MPLMLLMVLPFAAALMLALGARGRRRMHVGIAAGASAAGLALLLLAAPAVLAGTPLTARIAWIPALGLDLSLWLDPLGLLFAGLILGIGLLVVIYAQGYLAKAEPTGRFLSFLMLFQGAMIGIALSNNILLMLIFWELTSLSSFLLIGFWRDRADARQGARMALAVTGGGGLALIAGMLLLGQAAGSYELATILTRGAVVRASPLYPAILTLVLLGAFTKSAQFPFHAWLPNAMEAPTPVSAYLHSATMVKAGVYLLMRLSPTLGGTPAWEILLPFFGGVTLIAGACLALRQTDLKLMLAYTTMASLGLMVMLTGFGSEHAVPAAVLYLVAHSLFKGALFMVAGLVDHEAGTRDVTRLGGLRRAMPLTFAAALLAALSMAGLPLFFGFLAKEEIYYALAAGDLRSILFTSVAVIGNALMFAVAFAVALKPFLGAPVETPKHAHEGPVLLWLGPVVLAVLGLAAGLFSSVAHRYVSSPMTSAIRDTQTEVTISTIPHLGLPLLLSVITVALGVLIYLQLSRVRAMMVRVVDGAGPGPDRAFDGLVSGLVRLSVAVTRFVQPGRLEVYVTVTFILLALTLLVPPVVWGELPDMPAWPSDVMIHEYAFLALALIGVGAVLWAKNRLTAIVSLGIQGFAVAVIFLLFGAPDLSFTQFMVETLSVVILALVMTRLRLLPSDHRPLGQMLGDAAIALACGTGFALLLLKSTQGAFDNRLTDFFNAYSKVIAHGANVVNVIIVDFRGTDTLGEIAVVMITGLSILALIRLRSTGAARPADNDPDGGTSR